MPAQLSLRGPFGGGFPLLLGLQGVAARPGLGAGDLVQRLHQAADQRGRVDAERMRLVQLAEHGGCVAGEDRLQQAADAAAVGEAEHVAHLGGGDLALPMRDRLVEHRQTVARRALGRPGDDRQRLRLDLDGFRLGDLGEMRGELVGGDAAKVEALAARQDRDRHLVDLGGREQELHMLRRLLKCLQQGVESILGKHVDFVDDVDLEARR